MKWYYTQLGGHTHVRVFMNGGKCGDLCFRNEEFAEIRDWAADRPYLQFIDEGRPEAEYREKIRDDERIAEQSAREREENAESSPSEDSTGEERQHLYEAQD